MHKQLVTERTLTYNAHEPGLAAGDLYNGVAVGSSLATAMSKDTGADGKAIKLQQARRALVVMSLGALTTGLLGTVTAVVASDSEIANGASAFELPGFSLTYADTDSHKILKGEIDLTGIALPAAKAGDAAQNLWIRHNGTGVNVSIAVQLSDFVSEPTGETLTAGYPADILP